MEENTGLITAGQAVANLVERFLSTKRSVNTQRAYRRDVADFFGGDPTPDVLAAFLSLPYPQAIGVMLDYKGRLIAHGLAPATINRRMAALRALADLAHTLGVCAWRLDSQAVSGEKVQSYRDTSGISVPQMKALLASPDRAARKGRRDFALLLLLWENALRRAEIAYLNVGDYEPEDGRLWVKGKGRAQKEAVDLSTRAVTAIAEYLELRGTLEPGAPLFASEDRAGKGDGRLTPAGLYAVVKQMAEKIGIKKRLSPHRLRHSAITAALDATGGDVRAVRHLSRHSKIETLMVYDDNRQKQQRAISELLSTIA